MAYAIIEVGGKQYRVEKGDALVVDRLELEEGAKVEPRALLYHDDDKAIFEGADLGKVRVEAIVKEHLRGDKIRVFKYRPKKRYRKRQGHRAALTRLEIRELKLAGRRRPAAEEKVTTKETTGKAQARTESRAGAAKKEGAARRRPKTEAQET
jgi:large subunit ribosomal protein L21